MKVEEENTVGLVLPGRGAEILLVRNVSMKNNQQERKINRRICLSFNRR